jgi:integrase
VLRTWKRVTRSGPHRGTCFRVDRVRGPVWFAKYRLPDGRQVQEKIGPAWTERGRPAAGYFTKRTAEAWLRDLFDKARRGAGAGSGEQPIVATFEEAAAEWLRFIEQDRRRKPSTVGGYASIVRTQLLPTFGPMPLQSITADTIDAWLARTAGSVSSRRKSLVLLHGIFRRARKVWGLPVNPVADVEKPPLARSGDIKVFSPEEVWALVRAAGAELDGALYLTAAFTGLRMGELLALRWRDVDFAGSTVRVRASFYNGNLTTPSPAGSARSRSRPTLQRRWRSSAAGRTGSVMTTSSSPARAATTSMRRRYAAATRPLWSQPASARCASTTCAIRSAPA